VEKGPLFALLLLTVCRCASTPGVKSFSRLILPTPTRKSRAFDVSGRDAVLYQNRPDLRTTECASGSEISSGTGGELLDHDVVLQSRARIVVNVLCVPSACWWDNHSHPSPINLAWSFGGRALFGYPRAQSRLSPVTRARALGYRDGFNHNSGRLVEAQCLALGPGIPSPLRRRASCLSLVSLCALGQDGRLTGPFELIA